MTACEITEALQNLALPEYSSIDAVFGRVLVERSKQSEPECALLKLLSSKLDEHNPLFEIRRDCEIYVLEIGPADARKKCESDTLGNIVRPAKEFNGACGDFWSEMAAIRVLKNKGYSRFRAIHKKQPDGTTSDYEAYRGDTPAYIEVKNIRSAKTVLDIFMNEITGRYKAEPDYYSFGIGVRYPYSNPPTGDQARRIQSFVNSLRGRKPSFEEKLDLCDAVAQVNVVAGFGTAFMFRSVGPDSPEPLNKDRFLIKIRDKAGEALAQMKSNKHLKVLVINYDSPTGSVDEEFIREGEEVIRTVFGGAVEAFILLYRHLV